MKHGSKEVEISYGDFREWQRRNNVFLHAALISSVNLDYTVTGRGEPMQVEGTIVTRISFRRWVWRPAWAACSHRRTTCPTRLPSWC